MTASIQSQGTGIRALRYLFVILALVLMSAPAYSAPAYPGLIEDIQPDGSRVVLRVKGDEHFAWTEDADGYTVVRHKGWYKYAKLNATTGRLAPTQHVVGQADPRALGLQKRILPDPAIRALSRKNVPSRVSGDGASSSSLPQGATAPTGTVKNLVVLIRFSDHVGRSLPSQADMDVLFNAVGGDPALAPTGSIRDVYYENSYGQMVLDSDVQPWVTVSNTEAYYANGNSGDSTLWQALREALDILDASINFDDYDQDNDGYIDSIAFIHSGYGAEWGGTDAYGAPNTDRIWSHRWAIQPSWQSNEGVRVFDYHISPGVWGISGSEIGRIGVIAHETGHFFGLPDLYDTNSSGSGIGSWGLMANSWDFNGTQRCPPHFSPWSKEFLGWTSPTTIAGPGQYTLNEATFNAEVYRVDQGFPSNEYLLIENRQNSGFDCTIPQGGLVIWHIDDNAGYNSEGYPGQAGWPENGNHYRVAVLQADGQYHLERGNNRGDAGDAHHGLGVDAIGPGPGGHPNTDAYQGGTIIQTGHTISNISASGPTMSFCLNGCSGLAAPSGLSASAAGQSNINLGWNDNSSGENGFRVERSTDGSSFTLIATTGANVTAYGDSGLSPGNTYFYRVLAFDLEGDSGYSNVAQATTDDVPPAAPSGMTAQAVSESAIDLDWTDNAVNETGYIVDRSTDQSSWTRVANLGANATSFMSAGLQASTQYFYRVAATNGAGSSGFATASATTDDPPPYVDRVAVSESAGAGSVSGNYTDTHADDGNAQSINERESGGRPANRHSYLEHTWQFNVAAGDTVMLQANVWSSGSTDGDSFRFEWSTNGSSWNEAFTVSSTSQGNVQAASLPNSTSGTLWVRVTDTNQQQGNRALDTVYVDHLFVRSDNGGGAGGTPPAAPSSLSANSAGTDAISLGWNDNASDESGFYLERSPNGSSGWSVVATLGANDSAHVDSGLSADTAYYYRLRAFNAYGESGYTNVASATTDVDVGGGNVTLALAGSKNKGKHIIDLSWSGATSANVDIFRDGGLLTTTANDGAYRDATNNKGGGSYAYQVCEAGTRVCSDVENIAF